MAAYPQIDPSMLDPSNGARGRSLVNVPQPAAAPAPPGTSVTPRTAPNWTYGAPPAPPGQAPWDGSTGARQPFDIEAKAGTRTQRAFQAVKQAGGKAMDLIPGSVRTFARGAARGGTPIAMMGTAVEGGLTSTEDYAKRMGTDTGDASIGGMLKDMGVRAGGIMQDLGNNLTFGLADRVGNAIAGNGFNRSSFYKEPEAGPIQAPPLPAGNFTSGRDSFQGPSTIPSATPTIRRVGNTFTDGSDPGALTRISTVGDGNGGATRAAIEANTRRIYAEMAQTQRELDAYGPGGTPGMSGIRGTPIGPTPTPSLSILGPNGNMKPRDVRHAQSIAAEREIAGMRERGEMGRAQMNTATQQAIAGRQIDMGLRGQDQQFALSREGHAVQREGHMLSNDSARRRLIYDMNKDQRDYEAQRSDKGFEQGQQAVKDLHQEIGGMIPPTRDGDGKQVPDTANAARYATAMQTLVGRMGKTMKDIDASDKARFVAGMQLADVATATATGSMTPWGTRAIQSNEPILALRKLPNGDYQTNRVGVNGETEVIPARYIEKEGSTMGFGGRATNKFKALME